MNFPSLLVEDHKNNLLIDPIPNAFPDYRASNWSIQYLFSFFSSETTMVSTRQMTGATTEETTLYLFRSSSVSTSSSNSSSSSTNQSSQQPSSSNRPANTQSHHNGVSVTNAANAGSSGSGLAMVPVAFNPLQHMPPDEEGRNLLELPVEILGHIFSYVGYKKVSQMRVVSGNFVIGVILKCRYLLEVGIFRGSFLKLWISLFLIKMLIDASMLKVLVLYLEVVPCTTFCLS